MPAPDEKPRARLPEAADPYNRPGPLRTKPVTYAQKSDVVESAELAVEPDWDAGVIAARSRCCRVAATQATATVTAPQPSKSLSCETETVA